MSSETRPKKTGDDIVKGIIEALGEGAGRFLQGILSQPWTAIPFTLIVLAQIDPTGKLTVQFMANLELFLEKLSVAAGNALAQIGTGAEKAISTAVGVTSDPRTSSPPAGAQDFTIVKYGIHVVDSSGNAVSGRDRIYDSSASRDTAFIILQTPGLGIAYGDLFPNGPGTSYRKFVLWNQGNGWGSDGTVPAR